MEDLNIKLLSALKSLMPFIDADIDRGIRNDNRHGGLEYRARNAKAVILEAEHTIAAAEQAQQMAGATCKHCGGKGYIRRSGSKPICCPACSSNGKKLVSAKQQAEPVAWRYKERQDDMRSAWLYATKQRACPPGSNPQPLYIQPPAVAAPDGWDAESVRLAFSTLRYIIGLKPDGIKAPCDHVQDIIDKVASWSDMGPCHPVRKQYEAAAAHRAMLAAAPQGASEAPDLMAQLRALAKQHGWNFVWSKARLIEEGTKTCHKCHHGAITHSCLCVHYDKAKEQEAMAEYRAAAQKGGA